jgi:hypothetical protein
MEFVLKSGEEFVVIEVPTIALRNNSATEVKLKEIASSDKSETIFHARDRDRVQKINI